VELGHVEPAVQRVDRWSRHEPMRTGMQIVDVAVDSGRYSVGPLEHLGTGETTCGASGSLDVRGRDGAHARSARPRSALVRESPLAKSVTSWPRLTCSSTRWDTTRSVHA
jgi:hypothetical protein